jgi:hypothetical protein
VKDSSRPISARNTAGQDFNRRLAVAAAELRITLQETRHSGGFERLRGKDSNLDYLIQSQASYH